MKVAADMTQNDAVNVDKIRKEKLIDVTYQKELGQYGSALLNKLIYFGKSSNKEFHIPRRTLIEEIGCSKDTLKNARNKLEEKGLITFRIKHGNNEEGTHRSKVMYTLNLSSIDAFTSTENKKRLQSITRIGDLHAREISVLDRLKHIGKNQTEPFMVTLKRLCEMEGDCHQRTIIRSIQKLVKKGFITCSRGCEESKKNGCGTSNRYTLNWDVITRHHPCFDQSNNSHEMEGENYDKLGDKMNLNEKNKGDKIIPIKVTKLSHKGDKIMPYLRIHLLSKDILKTFFININREEKMKKKFEWLCDKNGSRFQAINFITEKTNVEEKTEVQCTQVEADKQHETILCAENALQRDFYDNPIQTIGDTANRVLRAIGGKTEGCEQHNDLVRIQEPKVLSAFQDRSYPEKLELKPYASEQRRKNAAEQMKSRMHGNLMPNNVFTHIPDSQIQQQPHKKTYPNILKYKGQ